MSINDSFLDWNIVNQGCQKFPVQRNYQSISYKNYGHGSLHLWQIESLFLGTRPDVFFVMDGNQAVNT